MKLCAIQVPYAHDPADFYRRADVLVNFIQSHRAGDRP